MRLRPAFRGHVWSYDFAMDRTAEGCSFRMLSLVVEHTRECLAIGWRGDGAAKTGRNV